jgi:hypothetical protein
MKIEQLESGHKVITLRTLPGVISADNLQIQQLAAVRKELEALADITPLAQLETFCTLLLISFFKD